MLFLVRSRVAERGPPDRSTWRYLRIAPNPRYCIRFRFFASDVSVSCVFSRGVGLACISSFSPSVRCSIENGGIRGRKLFMTVNAGFDAPSLFQWIIPDDCKNAAELIPIARKVLRSEDFMITRIRARYLPRMDFQLGGGRGFYWRSDATLQQFTLTPELLAKLSPRCSLPKIRCEDLGMCRMQNNEPISCFYTKIHPQRSHKE